MKEIIVIFLVSAIALFSQDNETVTPEKEQEVIKLMELTGSISMGVDVVEEIIGTYKSFFTHVPDDVFEEIKYQIDATEFMDIMVEIYSQHFTLEELREINKFYESPIGRKMTITQEIIMIQADQKGAKWGQKISDKIIEVLTEKGYYRELEETEEEIEK